MFSLSRSAAVLWRSLHTACSSCARPLPTRLPACTNCWHISNVPNSMSYYDILDVPQTFRIDSDLLKQRFRQAQSLCHPDSWASQGSDKGSLANDMSAFVNQAYQTLRNPLSRAEYILARNGFPMSEQDTLQDQEFMIEVMQTRETIEDAIEAEIVHSTLQKNKAAIALAIEKFDKNVSKGAWPAAKATAVQLRYLQNIERAGEEWLEEHSRQNDNSTL